MGEAWESWISATRRWSCRADSTQLAPSYDELLPQPTTTVSPPSTILISLISDSFDLKLLVALRLVVPVLSTA